MAGYIFNLDKIESLEYCIENGVYSTLMSIPKSSWHDSIKATFADYFSMKEEDNVYFFIKRNIYGIGKLKNIKFDCKFKNYPDALFPINHCEESIKDYKIIPIYKDKLKDNKIINCTQRCLCTFEPAPNFFKSGVDMDDVLSSNPYSFKMLRAFEKLSFVKIDDQENKALRDIILKRNEEYIYSNNYDKVYKFNNNLHNEINNNININYKLNSYDILKQCKDERKNHKGKITSEMAIECAIISDLCNNINSVFGKWDYISHQVIASPFKPIIWMDKMDIFGYKYIKNFDTISKYLTIEIKKDLADKDTINQIMKYVDWISQEYAYGDYNMIEAFIVAYDFPDDVINYAKGVCKRNYIKVRKPYENGLWTNLRFIKYNYNECNNTLDLIEIPFI